MRTNLLRFAFGCTFLLMMCISIATSQTVTGSITGEVTDPSGAVIPGATVTARNLDTGVQTSTFTNSTGVFHVDFLPIGHYQATVSKEGFNTETLPPFALEVLQTANFNIKLSVGSSATTVSVSAAAPILDTTDPTIESTFTANTIQNFPLNGLDFSALTLYVPGAVTTYGTSGMTSFERSTYNSDTPNFNGNRAQANNYTLDGIDMNETFNNLISYSPAPEALQEIQVLTANSPSDYGNVNGAGVVSVLKSGTNHFHGSAYGYVQDYRMDANSYSNNQSGIPINPYSFAQFGGTVGGPIFHNKLFFFADYLGSRQHKGGTGSASVMTQDMRNGNFSALLTGFDTPIQLYDPLNNFAPYANNENVPINNPVAKYLFANPKLYPLPNATPTDGVASNNYQAKSRSYHANDQGDVKIEYDPRANDKITGFYSTSSAYDGSTPVLAISFPGINLFPTWIVGSNWVHTFSPSLVNSARIGFTRTKWSEGLPQDSTGVFGTSGDSKVGITFSNQAYNGFTYQSLNSDLTGLGNPAYNGGSIIDNTYSYIDNLTWQRGRHYLSMGIEARRYQNNYPTGNNYGYLGQENYTGDFTADPSQPNGSGWGGADFVLDRVESAGATLGFVNVGQRQWRTAEYAQDSFKVNPNLTLTFGVRYEIDEPWVEQNNKTGNIDLATGQLQYASHVPAGAAAGAGICSNRGCYSYNFRQIMPIVGFAYQINDRAVVRGGYGPTSFYEGNSYNQRLTSITPFIQAVNVKVNAPAPGAVSTPRTAEEGFTGGTTQYGGTYNVYPKNIQPAYVQEFNLTLEYALTQTTSLQAGYVGETGQHIEDYGNVNQWRTPNDPTSAPFYNNQYIGVNADPSVSVGSNSLLITESRAKMNYNALQAVLRQRLNHGLEFTFNYTYGKAMTNSFGNYSLNVSGYNGAFQNYYDSAADMGPAGYDIKHDVSATGVYALPVGRGKEYLSSANHVLDEVIGGWKLSTAVVAYSGFPETITAGSSNVQSYGTNRANQYMKFKVAHRSLAQWYGDPSTTRCTTAGSTTTTSGNSCIFGVPGLNQFGTSHNGSVRGPGYFNADMSAFKDFHITESQTVGFRFDAFNAFNIVSYGNPDSGLNDGNFGNVSLQGTRSTERHLQFSAKYTF